MGGFPGWSKVGAYIEAFFSVILSFNWRVIQLPSYAVMGYVFMQIYDQRCEKWGMRLRRFQGPVSGTCGWEEGQVSRCE